MKATVRAEILKLRYQRSTYGLIAAASALSVISTISIIATSQLPRQAALFPLTDESTMRTVVSASSAGYLFALVLGIVMSTSEFRHGTAVATYLAQPKRRTVMLAKMGIGAIAGVFLQLISTSVGMLAGQLYVQRYEHATVSADTYLRVLAGALLVGAVLSVMGVAFGSLLRSQIVAIMLALLWLQLVEGLIVVFADWLDKWSIRSAIGSVLGVAFNDRMGQETGLDITIEMLDPWPSVALLLTYAAVLAIIATMTSMRRDVD